MARFKVETEQENGWSRWVPPQMTGYRFACCDCGLVHDMDFKVVWVTGHNADGTWEHSGIHQEGYRVLFRARRNNRSTAALKRKKAK